MPKARSLFHHIFWRGVNRIPGGKLTLVEATEGLLVYQQPLKIYTIRDGLKRGPLRFNQFGGTLGGPAWRNRTFFFGSFQGTRTRASNTSVVTVPTPEQVQGNFGGINIYDPANVVGGDR